MLVKASDNRGWIGGWQAQRAVNRHWTESRGVSEPAGHDEGTGRMENLRGREGPKQREECCKAHTRAPVG